MPSNITSGGMYPTEDIHFVALKDFPSGETMSHYVKGLSYRIRAGNEKLYDLVFGEDGWISKGDVRAASAAPAASVSAAITAEEGDA